MTGLELAEQYYYEVGRPMLQRDFPELLPRIAAGLVGEGSECFGYDDEISRDHDFGPGFCIWLTDPDCRRYGASLQQAYEALPGAFRGFEKRSSGPHAGKRVGVFSVTEFYARFIGDELPPASERRWAALGDEWLAAVTNGRVFEDGSGEFTAVREALLAYYPEPLRIRMIAKTVLQIAQTGQYNYGRCMRRGEPVAAELAKDGFLRAVLRLCYLLNRRYQPYYKWAFRGAQSLPRLREVLPLLEELCRTPVREEAWLEPADPYVNLADRRVALIEEICGMIGAELRAEGLSDSGDPFLEAHVERIASHIGGGV